MYLMNMPRGNGKTYNMIKESERTESPIICANNSMARYVYKQAQELGIRIPKPICVSDFIELSDKYKPSKVLIDELPLVLSFILDTEVIGATSTIDIKNDYNTGGLNMPTNFKYPTCTIDASELIVYRENDNKKLEPKRVIYNNPATIVFWNDGTKTIVKAMTEDTFDPERGYLQAYFEKTSGMSRTKCNKYLKSLRNQFLEE